MLHCGVEPQAQQGALSVVNTSILKFSYLCLDINFFDNFTLSFPSQVSFKFSQTSEAMLNEINFVNSDLGKALKIAYLAFSFLHRLKYLPPYWDHLSVQHILSQQLSKSCSLEKSGNLSSTLSRNYSQIQQTQGFSICAPLDLPQTVKLFLEEPKL